MNLIDKYLGEEEVNEKLKWESMLGGQKAMHKGYKVELRGNDYGWDYEIWKGNKRVKKSKMRQFPNQYDAKMEVEKILRKK